MKFDSIYEGYLTSIITEGVNNITAIYPGGFKPPHKGHFELIKSYSSDPNIFEVKILLGPKERTNISGTISITENMSREIWERYYIPALPGNVSIEKAPHPVPVRAAYEYVSQIAGDGDWITLMSSIKDANDAKRSREFAEKHRPGTGKYNREGVTVTYYPKDTVEYYSGRSDDKNNTSISASQMREDVAANDLDNFKTNLPDEVVDHAEKILNVLRPVSRTITDITDL